MPETPRGLALSILNKVDKTGAFAEPLINETLSQDYLNSKADRGLLTLLVYGVLRMRGYLDWIILKLCHKGAKDLDVGLRNILRIGLYQMFFTHRLPDFAIVNEAVRMTKGMFPGRERLVNAVLRNALRRKDALVFPDEKENLCEHISVVHSHPSWLVERLLKAYGRETTLAFCQANNQIPPLTIRANRLKASREQVQKELSCLGFTLRPTTYSPDGINITNPPLPIAETDCYASGRIYLQDEASQLVGYLVNPQGGERILDLCAGAGGKTTCLAEIMGNQGTVSALDINPHKIASLQETARRMGLNIIRAQAGDGAGPLPEGIGSDFNRILVDAPCSGVGTLRRNPEIKWRLKEEDIDNLRENQIKLLKNAACYLKKAGRLVYATCSVLPEENETVIREFLAAHPDFRLGPPEGNISKSLFDENGFFRTWTHREQTDNFFGAVLIKAGGIS